MAAYNWKEIFRNKDDKELIKIYSGNSHLNFEASIFAGLELKDRGFDFNQIEEIHRQKVEELKADILEYQNLNFKKSKHFKYQVNAGLALVVLVFLMIINHKQFQGDRIFKFYEIIIYILAFSILVITAKWNFNRFKKNKERTIEEKTVLLNRLTVPNESARANPQGSDPIE
jgi:hypothetical protein